MGSVLHHQPPFQNLLQAQLGEPVKEHSASIKCLKDRYASAGIFPAITHCDVQVLCWRHLLSGGKLQAGIHLFSIE